MTRDGGPLQGTSTGGRWRRVVKRPQMMHKAQVLHSQHLSVKQFPNSMGFVHVKGQLLVQCACQYRLLCISA